MEYISGRLVFILLAISIILLTLIATQLYSSKRPSATFICRKILHIISVGTCTVVLADSKGDFEIMAIFLLATILLGLEVYAKRLNISEGKSYGIALFPLAFAVLYFIGVEYRASCLGGLVLTFSDPLAGLIGKRFAQETIVPFKEPKSYLGAIVFFTVTMILLFLQPWFESNITSYVLIAIAATIAELFSWKGSDNLTIVLVVGILADQLLTAV